MHNQLFGFEIALAAVFGILQKKMCLKLAVVFETLSAISCNMLCVVRAVKLDNTQM